MENKNIDRAWASIPMPDWLFDAWKEYAEAVKREQRGVLQKDHGEPLFNPHLTPI